MVEAIEYAGYNRAEYTKQRLNDSAHSVEQGTLAATAVRAIIQLAVMAAAAEACHKQMTLCCFLQQLSITSRCCI
jgi:hypothetical protein